MNAKHTWNRTKLTALGLISCLALVVACSSDQKEPKDPSDGPIENTGEAIDDTASDVEDSAEEAAEDTGDAIEDATEDEE